MANVLFVNGLWGMISPECVCVGMRERNSVCLTAAWIGRRMLLKPFQLFLRSLVFPEVIIDNTCSSFREFTQFLNFLVFVFLLISVFTNVIFEWAACLLSWLILVFPGVDDGSGKTWVRKRGKDAVSEWDSFRELGLTEWVNGIGEKMFEPSGRTKSWLWKWTEGAFTFWTDSPDVCFLFC